MVHSGRLATLGIALLLGAAVAGLYGLHLDDTPPRFGKAEACIVHTASDLLTMGHDRDGRRWPLFVRATDTQWLQPIPVYAVVFWAQLSRHPADTSARWLVAAVSVLNVLLLLVITRRLVSGWMPALAAAALLALSPAHFSVGRSSIDAMAPVPFVLCWLANLLAYLDRPSRVRLGIAMAALGCGVFAGPFAVWTMPVYAAITAAALWRSGPRAGGDWLIAAAGFVLPLALLVPWYVAHPASYIDTMGRWGIHPADIRSPLEGLRIFLGYHKVGSRVSLYWDGFSPRYLFLTGGAIAPQRATRAVALLLPTVAFAAIGARRILLDGASTKRYVIVAGIMAAPLAMVLYGDRQALADEMVLLPLVAALAALGIDAMMVDRRRAVRWVAIALLALAPLQFARFAVDYFRTARAESATELSPGPADRC